MNLYSEDEIQEDKFKNKLTEDDLLKTNFNLRIGDIFENKYVIESILGTGGMSCVILATHQLLNKQFAIKILLPHLLGNALNVERFRQEAKSTINLNHPNIINVFDCDITATGQPYIVMDYVDGVTLAELIKEKITIPLDQSIGYFIQIADALDYAHKANLIHRDLKPSNVLISNKQPDKHNVKILDFGIAKSIEDNPGQVKLTQTGELFGSPAYMSPEQAKGSALDERSDIYSFGCLMYETLTGSVPFLSTNLLEIMQMHLTEPPRPMHEVCKNCSIPSDLELIVLKCLAKQPNQRYSSMAEIKDAILKISVKKQNIIIDFLSRIKLFFKQKVSANISTQAIYLRVILSVTTISLVCLSLYFYQISSQLPDLAKYFTNDKIIEMLSISEVQNIKNSNDAPDKATLMVSESITDRYDSDQYKHSSQFNLQEYLSAMARNAQLEFDSGRYDAAIRRYFDALKQHPAEPYDRQIESYYNGLWQCYLFKYLDVVNKESLTVGNEYKIDFLQNVIKFIKKLNNANLKFDINDEDAV